MKPLPHITDVTRPYWDAAREGRLLLQRCQRCQRHIHYPRPWCPYCWSCDLEWRPASGRGRVITFTVVHHPPSPAFAGDTPYMLAVIALAEGPQMMVNILTDRPDAVTIDMPVRVTFETRGDLAIPQFEPDLDAPDGRNPEQSETS